MEVLDLSSALGAGRRRLGRETENREEKAQLDGLDHGQRHGKNSLSDGTTEDVRNDPTPHEGDQEGGDDDQNDHQNDVAQDRHHSFATRTTHCNLQVVGTSGEFVLQVLQTAVTL